MILVISYSEVTLQVLSWPRFSGASDELRICRPPFLEQPKLLLHPEPKAQLQPTGAPVQVLWKFRKRKFMLRSLDFFMTIGNACQNWVETKGNLRDSRCGAFLPQSGAAERMLEGLDVTVILWALPKGLLRYFPINWVGSQMGMQTLHAPLISRCYQNPATRELLDAPFC